MIEQPNAHAEPQTGANTAVAPAPSSSALAEVEVARALLSLLADTSGGLLDRLAASCALAHLEDVSPPYGPAPTTESERRDAALRSDVAAVLLSVLATTDDVGQRARALLALHEVTGDANDERAVGTPR